MNYGRNSAINYELSLDIRSNAPGYLKVVSPGIKERLTFNVTRGDSTVQLPSSLLQNYTAPVQSKGVKIVSSVSVAITAIVTATEEGYQSTIIHRVSLPPASSISTNYIVGKAGPNINLVASKRSQFNITYIENGITNFVTGDLEPFDSYILSNYSSFTGNGIAVVSSSEPIAAYLYDFDSDSYQPTLSKTAGYKFIIPRTTEILYFRAPKFRISALHDNTFVKTTIDSETVIMQLDKGNFIESQLKATVTLSSNQPIVVMLNVLSRNYYSPQIWLYLPDVSQFGHEYKYSIEDIPLDTYVTIITPSAYEKELVFSETFVPEWLKTERVVLDNISYFVATTKLTGASSHRISIADVSGRFGGFITSVYSDSDLRLYPLSRECH